MADNDWLYKELRRRSELRVNRIEELILVKNWRGNNHKIYCPDHSEYIVTIDLVQRVIEMGGDMISYPSSWCSCSIEAKEYSKRNGFLTMPHGETFNFLEKWAART